MDEAGVCEVVLARAPLNEINGATLAELENLVAKLAADRRPIVGRRRVRGVLLRSGLERGFSAGADLRELHAGLERFGRRLVLPVVWRFLIRINRALTAFDLLPIPTVAAVHGVCFGGGWELALCCDLVVADRTARFGFPELRLGLIPGFGGLTRLRREVGEGRVRDLLLTGRSLNAERARDAGLVSQVTAPERHVRVARAALEQAMRLPGCAVAAAKRQTKRAEQRAIRCEIRTFLRLLSRPEASRALAEFVRSQAPLPYART